MARIAKLDTLVQKVYEDNVEGKISDERFVKLSSGYETEQRKLERRVVELKQIIDAAAVATVNVTSFLKLVHRYTDIQELDPEIIRAFVERVYIHQAERVNGQRQQRIRVVFNYIGEIDLSEIEKSA